MHKISEIIWARPLNGKRKVIVHILLNTYSMHIRISIKSLQYHCMAICALFFSWFKWCTYPYHSNFPECDLGICMIALVPLMCIWNCISCDIINICIYMLCLYSSLFYVRMNISKHEFEFLIAYQFVIKCPEYNTTQDNCIKPSICFMLNYFLRIGYAHYVTVLYGLVTTRCLCW